MFEEGTLDEELSEAARIDLANIEQITSFSLKYKVIKMKYGNYVANDFRMRTMLSLMLRGAKNTKIALLFNITPRAVYNLKKKVQAQIAQQVSRVDYNFQLGQSLILKDQLRAAALRAHDEVGKMTDMDEVERMLLQSRLRMEAQYHDNSKWKLIKLAIGDAKKYEPAPETDGKIKPEDMKELLDAMVLDDEENLRNIIDKINKYRVAEAEDDFILE